ncbi:major facilitator superfamily domain-containing protein [Phyllosticta citribraziliensis]|uniref:Major facilitator superfamily domain-containing protein n=1 Tax=Phyllosticta citribraziliensis TaxID=989973 RepID=A0ABR1LXV3_9PEZI
MQRTTDIENQHGVESAEKSLAIGLESSQPDAAASDDNARPAIFSSTIQEILFVLIATLSNSMSVLAAGTVVVMTAIVKKDLDMTTAEVTWINGASSLASGSFLLLFGRLADLFGRRFMLIGSLAMYSVFSLAAGFSQSPIQLDILNGFMGLSAAAAVPTAQGMLATTYHRPSKRKNRAFACFSAGNPLGMVTGSIFSGIAVQLFSWRASFWLLAIIFAVITCVAIFILPPDQSVKLPLNRESGKRLDIVGSGLTIAGIGMFSAALSLGSDAPQGWKTPYVLVLLILGVFTMVTFVFWEMYYPHPIVPMYIWKNRDFSIIIAVLLFGFLAFPTMSFWVSLFMQLVKGYGPLKVAVHLLPMAIGGITMNVVAGLIMHKVSNKLLMGIGAFCYTLSFLLLGLQHSYSSYWAFIFPGMLLGVVGADFEFCVANMYVMSSLPPSQQSLAGGIFQTVTKLCLTIGLGVSTAIFDAVKTHPAASGYHAHDPFEPFAATMWYCAAVAACGIPLVFFLRIGTQGNSGATTPTLAPEDQSERTNSTSASSTPSSGADGKEGSVVAQTPVSVDGGMEKL